MICTITYNGKVYTEQEFKKLVEASFNKYKATQSTQDSQEAYSTVMKQAEALLNWVDQYDLDAELDEDSDVSFEPKEISDDAVKEISKELRKITGLENNHFAFFANHVFNIAAQQFNVNTDAAVNEKALKSSMKKELFEMLDAYESTLNNVLEKLNLINKPDDKIVQNNIKKIQVAKKKLQLVKDNFDTIADTGLQKLYKFAGIKTVDAFKGISDLKELESNAVAIIRSKKGDHKYIFLNSQKGMFKQKLIPDTKKGKRKKGGEYFGIKIVADFYNTDIKDESGKDNADILFVDSIKEAQQQFDNYIEGGAKDFTEIEIFENNKESKEEIEYVAIDKSDTETDDEFDVNESIGDFEEVNTEREENYSQTSLEKNPKNSVRKELRILMAGIPKTDAEGNPVNTVMGIPQYEDFDTVFDNVIALMADKSFTFDEAIEYLKQHTDTRPWLNEFIERLKKADGQVKNQFLTTMGNHALTMNFVQYSFDKDGNLTLKVMNTNSAELRRKTLNTWKNNFLGSDLVEVNEGQYFANRQKAQDLLDEYESWFGNAPRYDFGNVGFMLSDLKKHSGKPVAITDAKNLRIIADRTKLKPGEKEQYLVSVLIDKEWVQKLITVSNTDGKVSATISEPSTLSPMTQLFIPVSYKVDGKTVYGSNFRNMKYEDQMKAVETVGAWLEEFGIDMHPNAIIRILNGDYYANKDTRVVPTEFFKMTDSAHQPIGILANWLKKAASQESLLIMDENEEKNHPFRDNAIENGLAKHQAKFVENVATSSFRSGKKTIYGYTAYKYVTDRFMDLRTNEGNIRDNLKNLAFSKHSAWLQWLENDALPNAFNISHLDLNAIKEAGKKIFGDNGITSLADADHELVKLGLFMDMKQGETRVTFNVDGVEFPMRIASMLFPTMSDKSTMVTVKSPVFSLNKKENYTYNTEKNRFEINEQSGITRLIFNQIVLPEIERILNFKEKNPNGTNIKAYDEGAKLLLFFPGLNDLKVTYTRTDGEKGTATLKDLLNSEGYTKLTDEVKLQIYPKINEYVSTLVEEKIKIWKENGIVEEGPNGINPKFIDSKYLKATDEENPNTEATLATMAFDFVVNQMIGNANTFMTIIGDPAVYYKANPKSSAIQQSKDTFINVGKRLAAMIAPGHKLAESKNETYYQVFLDDRMSVSQNIGFLTKLLDDKEFDEKEWEEIGKIENKDERKKKVDEFLDNYPNSADYFKIESTDAQEYTTWKEHLHILRQMGKTSDKVLSLTDADLDEAQKIFEEKTPLSQLTDAQKEIIKLVMQPIKPVYTGQIYDADQGVMRMMYIKSSSFPLIPQLTKGLELDKLRETMESFERKGKKVRASYQTANKVGALKKPLKIFDGNGKFLSFTDTDLENASLVLNRKDFKIQQDVPFKSAKRNEDTITMGSQLTKILFGNGMMDEEGFKLEGKSYSGRQLQQIYNETYIKLYNLKLQELYDELGIDSTTNAPFDVKATAIRLQKLLREEALDRGWSKQEIDGLELEFINDKEGNVTDYKFKLPLWMSANSNKIEALLNGIVNNRLVKMKFPGNSYIAGSEEGYKFQNDFKDVKKGDIVWLDSQFDGELKAAEYDEKGNLKSAQVLVASKFRDKSGKLIDLLEMVDNKYKYVIKGPKGFTLREDMFDKELLDLLTFRIPTSGHMSGSKVTIAGFLPHTAGDLMIVPKNFTKQKGLDFDVDKENGYQLWHIQDKNGKFRPINENDDIKNIEEKLLQNKLIRIHNAVYDNPNTSVQKKINAILSIDYAKEQAEMIDELSTTDDEHFTPMSDEYQKGKMALGAAGKIGTGAYSLDVTSHSLFEQMKASGNQLQLKVEKEDFKMEFGLISSSGKLGEANALIPSKKDYYLKVLKELKAENYELQNLIQLLEADPETGVITFESQTIFYPELEGAVNKYKKLQRPIAEVLSERQNIAVDNEKEQVMGKVNLNGYTLDIDKVLCMLGFDKAEDGNSIGFMFLSQPIIKDYVTEISKAKSNISGYDPAAETKVIGILMDKYFHNGTIEAMKEKSRYEFDREVGKEFTGKNMFSQLAGDMDNGFQLMVLNRFLLLKEYGGAIRGAQTAINTDSKGLGKSIPENGEKLKAIANLKANAYIHNAEKLVGDYYEMSESEMSEITPEKKKQKLDEGYIEIEGMGIMIKPETGIGAASINALTTAIKLWDKHFPYNTYTVKTVIAEIMALVSNSEANAAKKAEKQHMVLKEIKKYVNSRKGLEALTINSQTVTDERYRLMFDDIENNKVSLATYLSEVIKKFPQIKNNKLIQRFNYDLDYTGKPSLILYEGASGENFDEDGLNNALIELLSTNLALPSFNGELYTAKKLAQDLITYAIIEGGVQEATQFSRFIPMSYLEQMGFIGALGGIDFNSDRIAQQLFGIKPLGQAGPSDFAVQFARNNPTSLPKLKIEEGKEKDFLKKTFDVEAAGFTESTAPAFISYRIKGDDYVWQKVGGEYFPLEVAVTKSNGGQKLIGYDNQPYVSKPQITKPSKKKQKEIQASKVELPIPVEPKTNDNAVSNLIRAERFGLGRDNFVTILNNILKSENIPANITEVLKQLIANVDPNTTIQVVSGLGSNGQYSNGKIKIDKKYAENATDEELARTILKETVHSVTDELILKHTDEDGQLIPKDGVPGAKAAREIITLFKRADAALSSGKYAEKYKSMKANFEKLKKGEKVGFDREEKRILYGVSNIKEFIEMILTQPEFQKAMSEIKIGSSNTTLMDKFRAFIKSVFEAIGIKESGTVTDEAIKYIFELIEESKPKKTTTVNKFDKKNIFSVKPIQSADKKAIIKASIATQYIGFGEGINNSSTELYRQQAGEYANTGNYSPNDVIFVSVPGKRGDAKIAKEQQDRTIKEAIKAIEAGATILTDNKKYIFDSTYNTGEQRLYQNLEAKGYSYSETTVDGQLIGTWSKPQVQTQPVSTQQNKVVTETVAEGIEIKRNALTESEQLELFNILKPYFESQGAKTNKNPSAPLMIGLNLRWDYKSNNPNYEAVNINKTIDNSEQQRNKYGYYTLSVNGQPLGPIDQRIKDLISKATGIDATNYDGAIINLYNDETFISAHNDVDESATAIGYPVLVVNIGGSGNFSVEGAKKSSNYSSKVYEDKFLNAGDAYVFGIDGKNRDVYHRTFKSDVKGFLPELTINNENTKKTYPEGSYRISITLRRVMDLEPGMPKTPNKIGVNQQTQPTTTQELFTIKIDQFNYTYNPATGEVIHNAKSGDKVETNETQINKVLAAYAYVNNFETKEFNKQKYVKIRGKVLNVVTGSRVTQKEILDLFTKSQDEQDSYEPDEALVKQLGQGIVNLINTEREKFELNPDSVDFFDENYSKFNGYPNLMKLLQEESVTAEQAKFFETHKDMFEYLVSVSNATSYDELMDYLADRIGTPKLEAPNVNIGLMQDDLVNIEKELAEAEEILSESGEKIELFPEVFANKGQTAALEKLYKFMEDSGRQVFVLNGRGGTGKTTIIKKVLEKTKDQYVAAATLSHKAKSILQNSMGKSVQVTTIAAAIGLRPKKTNPSLFEVDPKFNKSISPFYKADVIIIDECSMLTQDMVKKIINFSVKSDVKIIFMGDNVQLPPIEENAALQNLDSKSFTANTKPEYTATLTERMRQGEDSPIVVLSDVIAANVERPKPELRIITDRRNKFDAKKNKGVLFETKTSMVSQLEKDLNEDVQNTKIITYTNDEKDKMNNLARKLIWGEGNTNEFNKGEILICEDSKEAGLKSTGQVFNAEQYIVLSSQTTQIMLKKLNTDYTVTTGFYPGYKLEVQKEDGTQLSIIVLSPKVKSQYKALQTHNRETAEKLGGAYAWDPYWKNEDEHIKVEYGYAITSHKAQGSTHINTYVMEDNILGVEDASEKTKNQSLYVAVTRPRNKVVIVSNKNASNVIKEEDLGSKEEVQKQNIKDIKRSGKSFEPTEDWTKETNECGI